MLSVPSGQAGKKCPRSTASTTRTSRPQRIKRVGAISLREWRTTSSKLCQTSCRSLIHLRVVLTVAESDLGARRPHFGFRQLRTRILRCDAAQEQSLPLGQTLIAVSVPPRTMRPASQDECVKQILGLLGVPALHQQASRPQLRKGQRDTSA